MSRRKVPYIDKIIDKIDFPEVFKAFGKQNNFYTIADDTHAELQLAMSHDGDIWMRIIPDQEYPTASLRFRVPMVGGARSYRIRSLLMLLALGMIEDEKEMGMVKKEFSDLPNENALKLMYLDFGEIDYQI